MRRLFLLLALAAVLLPTPLAAQSTSGQVNGEGCWCGYLAGTRDFVVRGKATTTATKQGAADAIAEWNRYARVLTLSVDPSGTLGRIGNGVDEVNVLIDSKDALAAYGFELFPGLFGIAVMEPEESFGGFSLAGCSHFSGEGCGPVVEADVLLNADFDWGWTDDWFAPGFDYEAWGPGIVQDFAIHEVGHCLGLQHVFDLPGKQTAFSIMNYANNDVTRWVTRIDANTIRAAYASVAQRLTDVGIFPFTYGNGQYAQSYTTLGRSSVLPGEVFSLDRWTLDNLGTEAAPGVEVRFYAWPAGTRKYPEPSDVPLGAAAFGTVPVNAHAELAGTPLTVPAGTGAGTYAVGAIVFVGGAEDSPWVAGRVNNNRFAAGHDPFLTLTVLAPPASGQVSASFSYAPAPPLTEAPVSFSDTSSGAPAAWRWDFGDLSSGAANLSTERNPVHLFSGPGAFTVTLTASGPSNRSSAWRVVTVGAAAAGRAGVSTTRVVPILLDAGASPRYTSELTLANRGATTSTLTLLYTAAPSLGAAGSGTVSEVLGPGRQLIVPEAIAYLRQKGLPIPLSGAQGGTLRVTFSGLSSDGAGYAGARTTTASGKGRCGLSYPGTDVRQAFTGPAVVFGLRQDASDRSNLAVLNAGTSSPITVRVTVAPASGATGVALPDLELPPGVWYQYDSVLNAGPFAEGRATIERIAGTEPFLAYGVVNDTRTNDGSYLGALPSQGAGSAIGIPAAVESSLFRSDLVVASLSSLPSSVYANYVESAAEPKGETGWFHLDLDPYEQRTVPDLLDALRRAGAPIGPRGPLRAGYLQLSFSAKEGKTAGVAGVRTSIPAAAGGEYGAFSTSSPATGLARDAWIYGLQQNAAVRSNLAVTNAGLDASDLEVRLQLFDGETGLMVSEEVLPRLKPLEWTQRNSALGPVRSGYGRLTVVGGTGSFLAYGVVNDGADAASGTNDGSTVAMEAALPGTSPDELTVTLDGGVPLTMARIPAGTFLMGSPEAERSRAGDENRRAVTLTRDTYVGKYAVTQGQWRAVMGTAMPMECGSTPIGPDYPVTCVSWNDVRGARGFIEKLNAYLGSRGEAGAGKFRLPTEAEWERAARGGTGTRFWFGDALDGDDECGANPEAIPYVWWCSDALVTGHPVGTKGANPYGLFDVHGGVS